MHRSKTAAFVRRGGWSTMLGTSCSVGLTDAAPARRSSTCQAELPIFTLAACRRMADARIHLGRFN
jgi:hypothetical protein